MQILYALSADAHASIGFNIDEIPAKPQIHSLAHHRHREALVPSSRNKNRKLRPRIRVSELFCDISERQTLEEVLKEVARWARLGMRASRSEEVSPHDMSGLNQYFRPYFRDPSASTQYLAAYARDIVYQRYRDLHSETTRIGEGEMLITCAPSNAFCENKTARAFPLENQLMIVRLSR